MNISSPPTEPTEIAKDKFHVEYDDSCDLEDSVSRVNIHQDIERGGVIARPNHRSVKSYTDECWEIASHNKWYQWAMFTVKQMTPSECIICAENPSALPTVVPEKYTHEECAKVQQRKCNSGEFNPRPGVRFTKQV